MHSTMQDDYQLTVAAIFKHGRSLYPDSRVVTNQNGVLRTATFAEVAARSAQLANALTRLGIRPGDRVGTLCWNTQEHLEAYLTIPSMGAILHTLNPRISPEQLAYIIDHAGDRIIIVDESLLPVLDKVSDHLRPLEAVIVIGDNQTTSELHDYEDLIAAEQSDFEWPELDEKSAAAMCYTSGTTGNPKGVVYSHRSTYLHSMAECTAGIFGLSQHDRVLPIVPMFHANAWGLAYASWLAGSDLVMPGRSTQPKALSKLIEAERPTVSAAVPTVWSDLAHHLESTPVDLSSLRLVVCGGAAVPRHLIEFYQDHAGVRLIQAWGMTETSPIAAVSHPPRALGPDTDLDWRAHTGRVVAGVELELLDESGNRLPWDGQTIGEIAVRGPWITGAYHSDSDASKFHNGWLRTGDVGTVKANGFIRITDRAKDVIKSGGEWISSVELEAHIMAHPDVLEAAVVAIADARWQERPLACVVLRKGINPDPGTLKNFLAERVPKWWLPEQWMFIDEVPKTSVGKFDKKVLRSTFADDFTTTA